jgi:hypothetical protein
MTTVTEFIAYLQTLPTDAKVIVPRADGSNDWQDLVVPAPMNPYSSITCWFDDLDNAVKIGE